MRAAKLEALRDFTLLIAAVMSGPRVLQHENARVLSLALDHYRLEPA